MDDIALLRLYADTGSDDTFHEIVDRHLGFVYSAALRQLRDHHLAEEATQAVFILLARKAGTLRSGVILPAWLHRTTYFAVQELRRTEARRRRREQEAHMEKTLMESTGSGELWDQIRPSLDEIMHGLNEKDRQALVLRFFQGKTLREVGDALGIGEDTAQKRVGRALDKLRIGFARRGFAVSAIAVAAELSNHAVEAAPVGAAIAVKAAVANSLPAAPAAALVKGILKMMAMAHVKTAAVAGAAILATGGAVAVIVAQISSGHDSGQAAIASRPPDPLPIQAVGFLMGLKEQNRLPGFVKEDHGTMRARDTEPADQAQAYPALCTIDVVRNGDANKYEFAVEQVSQDSPLRLTRAWQTDPQGRHLAEFSIQR